MWRPPERNFNAQSPRRSAEEAAVNLTDLPVSSVPAAFDRGHLYSPTLDLTAYALNPAYIYDYRPGDLFEPMPPAPHGGKPFAWWWNNVAKVDTPDFLGLHVGDEITVHNVSSTTIGTVLVTWRAGALVRYPYPSPSKTGETIVRRRNDAGHWY